MQLRYDTAPLTLLTTWFVIPMFENSLKSWLLALTNGYIEKYTGIEFVCLVRNPHDYQSSTEMDELNIDAMF